MSRKFSPLVHTALAGFLTNSLLHNLPGKITSGKKYDAKLSGIHSSESVQDSHLIPFSIILLEKELSPKRCKTRKFLSDMIDKFHLFFN